MKINPPEIFVLNFFIFLLLKMRPRPWWLAWLVHACHQFESDHSLWERFGRILERSGCCCFCCKKKCGSGCGCGCVWGITKEWRPPLRFFHLLFFRPELRSVTIKTADSVSFKLGLSVPITPGLVPLSGFRPQSPRLELNCQK